MLSQKETSLLKDLQSHEQLCIDKYTKYENQASNPKLKGLMNSLAQQEKTHLQTINQIMNGQVPPVPQSQAPEQPADEAANYTNPSADYSNDKYILSDALTTEKHVSSAYNTSIFEFKDVNIRGNLNHLQKEEQEHGEKIYNYMAQNGMYC